MHSSTVGQSAVTIQKTCNLAKLHITRLHVDTFPTMCNAGVHSNEIKGEPKTTNEAI